MIPKNALLYTVLFYLGNQFETVITNFICINSKLYYVFLKYTAYSVICTLQVCRYNCKLISSIPISKTRKRVSLINICRMVSSMGTVWRVFVLYVQQLVIKTAPLITSCCVLLTTSDRFVVTVHSVANRTVDSLFVRLHTATTMNATLVRAINTRGQVNEFLGELLSNSNSIRSFYNHFYLSSIFHK